MKNKKFIYISSVVLLGLGISFVGYLCINNYYKNKYVNEYVHNVFDNEDKIRDLCVKKYTPKEETTLGKVIYVNQLCECATINLYNGNVLKEPKTYNAIKKHIVNVFNIAETREKLIDIAFIYCVKDFTDNPDKEKPEIKVNVQ
ncbi:MAG: hypothetical protein IJQ55_00050 [Alphaproteobacteria bacterium]|nr:hypothetical protein [Alphaproteobacteria bacterium]